MGKGLHISEADTEEAIFGYFTPGLPFLKKIETYSALPLERVMPFTPR